MILKYLEKLRGHEDIVGLLLMNGANIDVKDSKGRKPQELFNSKPFNSPGGFVPNYIACPDLGKLWGVPSMQDADNGPKTIQKPNLPSSTNSPPSPSTSVQNGKLARKRSVSFQLDSSTLDTKSTSITENSAKPQEATTSEGTEFVEDATVEVSESPKAQHIQRADLALGRISSSIEDIQAVLATSIADEYSAVLLNSPVKSAKPSTLSTLPQSPIACIPSTLPQSPIACISTLPQSPSPLTCIKPSVGEAVELLVYEQDASSEKLTIKGSIFVEPEMSLTKVGDQIREELDDIPEKISLFKEKESIIIPIGKKQMNQNALLHYKTTTRIIYKISS